MWLENLHHFSNLCDNFQFNVIWHIWSMATLILRRRTAASDVTVMPSVTCMDWLNCRYKHMADVVATSTALAFVKKISEKWKSTSPSGIQIKSSDRQSLFKTTDVKSSYKKVEQNVDIRHNVRLAHSCTHPIPDNADRIKDSAKPGTKWVLHFYCITNT